MKTLGAHDYGCVLFPLPDDLAAALHAWKLGAIDPADLVEDEPRPHVTARYGFLPGVTGVAVADVVSGRPALRVRFGGLAAFESAEHDVLYIEVISDDLRALHRALGRVPHSDQQPGRYVPHCTVAYLQPGRAADFLAANRWQPLEFQERVIRDVQYVGAEGDRTLIPLAWRPAKSYKFNPSQPRDDHGRWTDAGGATMPTREHIGDGRMGDISGDVGGRRWGVELGSSPRAAGYDDDRQALTYLHGTTAANAAAIRAGGFKAPDHIRLAAAIEDRYGLPSGAVLESPAFRFNSFTRATDENVYFSSDPATAEHYTTPESVTDALGAAYDAMHPEVRESSIGSELYKDRARFIREEGAKLGRPEVIAVTIPWETIRATVPKSAPAASWTYDRLRDEFGDELPLDTVGIPARALAGVLVSPHKRPPRAHSAVVWGEDPRQVAMTRRGYKYSPDQDRDEHYKYSDDQPRDEYGRWTEGAGAGRSDDDRDETEMKVKRRLNRRDVTATARRVAARAGYDPSKVRVTLRKNARYSKADPGTMGVHWVRDGVSRIEVYHDELYRVATELAYGEDERWDPMGIVKSTTAHEVSHDAFRHFAMSGAGEYAKRWLGDGVDSPQVRALAKDDGFTPYSELWWHKASSGRPADIRNAINETVAEVAAWRTAPFHVDASKTPSRRWRDLEAAVRREYRAMKRERRDLTDRQRGHGAPIDVKAWGGDEGGESVTVPWRFGLSVTIEPDGTVRYHRTEEAKSGYKYSEDQARDDHGRWTDGGGGSSSTDGAEPPKNESPRDEMTRLFDTPEGARWWDAIDGFVQATDEERKGARQRLARELKTNPTARRLVEIERAELKRRFGKDVKLYRGIYVKPGKGWDGTFPPFSSWTDLKTAAKVFGVNENREGFVIEMKVPTDQVVAWHGSPVAHRRGLFEPGQNEWLLEKVDRVNARSRFQGYWLAPRESTTVPEPNEYVAASENFRRLAARIEMGRLRKRESIFRRTEPKPREERSYKYSDDQARDENGRWTDGGGSERPRARVDTPEFRAWFAGSKVVDADGAPLALHHSGSFNELEGDVPVPGDEGMHFGTEAAADMRAGGKPVDDFIREANVERDDENGRWYWESQGVESYDVVGEEGFETEEDARDDLQRNAQRWGDVDDGGEGPPRTVAYLAIRNPKRVKDQGGASWAATVAQAKREGHDGLVYRNEFEDEGSDSWVAFRAEQIKSVYATRFDGRDPDITKHYGPGEHESGSPQSAHGGESAGGGKDDLVEDKPTGLRVRQGFGRDGSGPRQRPVRHLPPPPEGKAGGKAGGWSATGESNTHVGDLSEKMLEKLNLERVTPGRRQGPLDLFFKGSNVAFEVKTCTRASREYKLKPKKSEVKSKREFARRNGWKANSMIVVLDHKKGKGYAYWRKGLGYHRFNPKSPDPEWNELGTFKFARFRQRKEGVSAVLGYKFDPGQPRDENGRWTDGGGSAGSGGGQGGGQQMGTGTVWVGDDGPSFYQRPPVDVVDDIDEALTRIEKGEVIELRDVSKVNTLLTKMAAIAKEAKAAGKQAPNYDLCKVSVKGTNLFCARAIRNAEFPEGIPRLEMPQLGGKPVPGSRADALPRNPWDPSEVDGAKQFIEHVKSLGIGVTTGDKVPAARLKGSQREMVGTKIAAMMLDEKFDVAKNPLFVSRDNYVVDGHHRWAAIVGRDSADGKLDVEVPVIRIDAPIVEVLRLANKWSRDFGIQPAAAKGYATYWRAWAGAA